jgi:hypothetical protein
MTYEDHELITKLRNANCELAMQAADRIELLADRLEHSDELLDAQREYMDKAYRALGRFVADGRFKVHVEGDAKMVQNMIAEAKKIYFG